MKKKIKLIGLLLLAVAMIVGGVLKVKTNARQDVYTEVAQNGYVSGRNIDQVMFFYPEGINADLYLTQKIPSDYEKGKLIELVKDDTFSVGDPDKSLITVYKESLKTEEPTTEKLFSELEKGTGIRITNYSVSGSKKDSKISKTILNVTAECMFSTDVYNDFTGKLALVKRGNDVCYMFIGNTSNGKLSADAMTYMAKSLHYIDYRTSINADATLKNTGNEIEMSDENPIKTGEFGKTYVINKTDHPKVIDAAVRVDDVNHNAAEEIESKLNDSTIYQKLPTAKDGYTWQMATISYSYLDHIVKEVKPYMNVRVTSGKTETTEESAGKDDIGRTYVLSDDAEPDDAGLYHMVIFYEAPEKYSLEFGDGNGDADSKLKVTIGDDSTDE